MELRRSKKDFWFTCVDTDVLRDKKLSGTSRLVFAVICSYANINTRSCFPKIKTIAEDVGLSERTVQRALTELEERGVLKRFARYRKEDGTQISSEYVIYGFHASCYEQEATPPLKNSESVSMGVSHFTDPVKPVSDQEQYQENDINDSLKGEAKLPIFSQEKNIPENKQNDLKNLELENRIEKNSEKNEIESSKEIYAPEAAPDIMRPTARYLLQRTGRKKLTWDEISALRELTATQFPTRVQKEIDVACERFLRNGHSLKFLNFVYLATALRNQPTRSKYKNKNKIQKNSEINPVKYSEEELAKIEELYGLEAVNS